MSAHSSMPAALPTDAARVVDAIAGGRVLVIGSLPPDGRDLDLALRRSDVAALATALEAHGFQRCGGQHVRFAQGTAAVVELTVLEDWGLPESEVDLLVDQATPLPGMRRLARPSAAHTLLLLAPLGARAGTLSPRRRDRLETALREDSDAWGEASRHAEAWRVTRSLRVLRDQACGRKPSRTARIRAVAQSRRTQGTRDARALAGAARRVLPRPRRGAVVTLSGVDGAGKSSQALALAAALERLGEDPEVVWSRVRYDPLLAGIGRVVKKVLAPWGGDYSGTIALGAPPKAAHDAPVVEAHSASMPRRLVEVSWAHVCAAVAGYRHLRLCLPGLVRGRVVICDRYTLDTHVHLGERFHAHPGAVRTAARLARIIAPRPMRGYWLDLPPDTAWARKPDDVNRLRLEEHVRAYEGLHHEHDVTRLDARHPAERIAAAVAFDVWSARCRAGRRAADDREPPGAGLDGVR